MDYTNGNIKNSFVSRVNQLDAVRLDKEVVRIIRESLINSLQDISPSILVKYQPELDVVLNSSVWLFSIAKHASTFGQQMLLISYVKENATMSRLTLHFLLSILPQYLKDIVEKKWTSYEKLQNILHICEHLYIVISVINFFRFLKTGKYPTLIDFICGLDCVSLDFGKSRRIGFDYMTRELIWSGLLEFLSTVLPFINYRKVLQYFKNITLFSSIMNSRSNPLFIDTSRMIFETKFDETTKCAECNERPALPHRINCGHVFCYYCIYENTTLDSEYCCPLCQRKAKNVSRVEWKMH